MKRLLKRWLAMVLAVLMVSGVLPMNVLAARVVEDETPVAETPVLGKDDGVVDTLAAAGDDEWGEVPENPVDPIDPDPVEPTQKNWKIRIDSIVSNASGKAEVTITITGDANSDSGNFILGFVPDISTNAVIAKPSTNGDVNGTISNASGLLNILQNVTGLNSHIFTLDQGSNSGNIILGNDGTFTHTYELDASVSSIMGDLVGKYKDGTQIKAGDSVELLAILITYQGSDSATTGAADIVMAKKTMGDTKAIPDATYILNLSGEPSVPTDSSQTDNDLKTGTWSKGMGSAGTMTIPLKNLGSGTVVASFWTGATLPENAKGISPITISDPTGSLTITKNQNTHHEMEPGNKGTITIPVSNGAAGTFTISVPYYTPAVIDEATGDPIEPPKLLGTAKIQVVVIENGANPVIFHIDYGETAAQPNQTISMADPTIDAEGHSDYYLLGPDDSNTGDPSTSNGVDLGVGFEMGTEVYWEESGANTNIIISGKNLTGKNAKITFEPGKATTDLTIGTHETSVDFSGATFDGSGWSLNVPVYIIVHGGYANFMNEDGSAVTASRSGKPGGKVSEAENGVPAGNWTNVPGGTTALAADAIVLGGRDQTLTYYPVSEVVDNTFTLKYDGNGNTSGTAPGNQTHASQETTHPFKASGNTGSLAKTGYTFKGWNTDKTAASAGTVEYAVGADVTVPANDTVTLFAVWEQTKHKVEYTAGTLTGDTTIAGYIPDAETPPEGTYTVKGLQNSPPTPILDSTGKGWTFGGWKVAGSETVYGPADGQTATYNLTGDVTFVAQWAAKTVTVTYDQGEVVNDTNANVASGKTELPANKTDQQYGAEYTVLDLVKEPLAEGWDFIGWHDGTSAVAVDAKPKPTTDLTLTAQWKVKVTFDANGGTLGGSSDPQWVDQGSGHATVPGNPSYAGHGFDGWYDAATGGNKITFATKTFDEPTTLYAHWNVNSYDLIFETDHGTAPDSQSKQYNEEVDLSSSPTLTVPGWTFGGWAATNGGTDKLTTFNMPASDKTVYAIWTQKEHTLTWNANDGHWGSGETATTTQTVPGMHYGDPIKPKVPETNPVRDNYRFLGWAATEDGNVVEFKDNTPTMPDDNDEYFAKWQGLSWVKFNPDGGVWSATAGDNEVKTYQDDTGEKLGTNNKHPGEPTKEGYTFGGWKRSTDNAAVDHDDIGNETFPATAGAVDATTTVTYTAIWTENPATVTVNIYLDKNASGAGILSDDPVGGNGVKLDTANDATPSAGAKVLTQDSKGVYSADNIPTSKDGAITYYVFVNNKKTGVTVTVNPGGNETASVQYWTVEYVDYTPPHAASDATFPESKIVQDNGKHTVDSTTKPAGATGWSFKEWTKDGATATGELTITAKTTLVAAWNRVEHTVTFDPNGGAWSGSSDATRQVTNIQEGKSIQGDGKTMVADPAWNGYTFGGWFQKNGEGNFTGSAFTATTVVTADITVYAKWTANNYTITWNGNGGKWGDDATKTESKPFDTVIPKYTNTSTLLRTDYTFTDKWYTEAACTNEVTFSETGPKVPANDTTVFYAGWTRNKRSVEVEIHKNGELWEDFPETAVVIGTAADAPYGGMTGKTANGAVTFTNVPWDSANAYTVFVGGVDVSSGDVAQVTVNADTQKVIVNYYDLTVQVTRTNSAGAVVGAVAQSTSTITGTSYTDTTTTEPYLKNTVVNLATRATDNRFTFKGWGLDPTSTTDITNKDDATAATVKVTKQYTATADYGKDYYNTTLDVTVNTAPHTDESGTDNVTKVELFKKADNTKIKDGTYTDGHWTVTNVEDDVAAYWKVTTVDKGEYTVDAVKDGNATMPLFGVTVKTGETGNAAVSVKGSSASSTAGSRVVMPVGNATASQTPATGYDFVAWVQTANPTVSEVTIFGNTVTLATDYSHNADLEIKPTYTYHVTVQTKHGSDLKDTTVTAAENGGTGTGTVTKTSTGTYKIEDLVIDKEYNITVNDFLSDVSISEDDITAPKVVQVYQITTAKEYHKPSSGTPNGTSQVQVKDDTYSTTSRYLPQGAKTDGTNTVNVKAAEGTNERLTHSVTYETEGDVALWSMDHTDKGVSIADADINKANPAVTLTGLSGDVIITAHFVLQYNVTVGVSNGTAATPASTAAFTDKQSSASVINTPDTGALVDATTYVKAKFDKGTGETLTGWTISADGGDLYSDSDLAAGHKITDPSTHTGTEVYFVPAKEGATLTANVKTAEYEVAVTVKKDNGNYLGREVWLSTSDTSNTKTKQLKDDDGDSVYKAEVPAGTYYIWVDGVTDGSPAYTQKPINFDATDMEGATSTDETKKKATEEVNYYTIKLVADPATGTAPNVNKVDFGTSVGAGAGTSDEMIVLATNEEQEINIAAQAYYNKGASPRYKFKEWELTKVADMGSFTNDPTEEAETFKLKDENTLKSKTGDDAFKITKDNQITLTAKFVERIIVKVELDSAKPSDFSRDFGVRVTEEADTPDWTTATQEVEIDKGDSVLVRGGKGDGVTSNDNYVLSEWRIKPENGGGNFDNSYLAGTNAAAAAVTDKGYKLQGGKFTPNEDTTLVLHGWTRPTLRNGWTYDKAQPDLSEPKPPNDRRSIWTPNDNEATPTAVRIYDRGDGTTVNETLTTSDYTTTDVAGSTTNQKYYTVDEDYLKDNIAKGPYYLGVDYTLGADTHPNRANGTAYVGITISATRNKLTEALVEVEDGTSGTANQSDPKRDAVQYKSHEEDEPKVLKEELVFTWYYADEKPTWKWDGLNKGKTEAEALKAAQTLVNALNGVQLTTVANYPSDVATEVKEGIVNIKNTDMFTDDLRGKYVFAIVTVGTKAEDGTITPGTETAYGTVITNAIPVDYDAEITVNEDGDPVDETEAAGYKVYLWPTDGGAFNLDKVVDGKKVAIPTSYNKTKGKFETKDSPLIGEKTYHVYVREVEGKDEQYIQHKDGSNAVVISRTNTTDTVDYYTVTLPDLGKQGWNDGTSDTNAAHPHLEHFKDSSNEEVGESWDYDHMPKVKAETSVNHVEVGNGKAVLKTTAVKATATDLELEGDDAGKAWLQDYDLEHWLVSTNPTVQWDEKGSRQTSKTAVSGGYTTDPITAATWITGKLIQNTYEIKGDVKDLTDGTKNGQIESDVTPAANKPVPTLTYQKDKDSTAYVFKATGVTVNGGDGAAVTFKVPRSSVGENKGAIVGTYFLEATPKADPATTLKGYSVPTATEVPDSWTRNVDVAAETTGAALNDRFTIFIESTALTLEVKDGTDTTHVHQRSGNTQDTAATFIVATGRHNDTWKYNSKTDSYEREVIITNKGNTSLKVTPTLEKYKRNADGTAWVKDSTFSYTPADNAFEDDLGNNKKTSDPKKIGFSNWKDSYPLAADGGTETITVTVPANLENSDDVLYRFIFESVDGRDGYTGTGPTLWFELETIVNPVEVTQVTTEHPGGNIMKYTVKTTTIAEDATETGTPYYDALQKPQESGGLTSGAPKADNDLVYEWYVADWQDHSKITLDKEKGKLYKNGVEMTPEALGVSKDTLTFDLIENPAAQGKTLYLLAKGTYNAKGAATTPDVTNKVDPPMQMPYTGKIYIKEDNTVIPADTGYTVYLWNKADGAFDITSDKKIEATWVAPADGNDGYFAADNLYAADPSATNAYTYEVWTNKVKGAENDTAAYFQNSNQVVTGAVPTATVVYHSVTLNNTTVDNAPYNDHFTANSDLFFRHVDGTTVTKIYEDSATDEQKKLNAPTAQAGAIDVATNETDKWVQTGTSVTATYPDWATRDYKLTWDGGANWVTTNTTDSTKTYTVNAETEVDTQLKLNIYNVEAHVNGTTGKAEYFTMVLTDGEQSYTFTSKTNSPGGNAILGVETTANEIVAGDHVVFKLPAATYVTKVTMPSDTAAILISYTDQDGNDTEVAEGAAATTTINVVVDSDEEYSANLQGDGVSISFADNIPAATTIDGVNLETSGAKSQNGNAGITPKDGGVEISKKDAVQTIHLNYNSYTSEIPVEISFINKSKYDTDNTLKNVTFAQVGTATAKPGGGESIVLDTTNSTLSTTGIEMPSNADATDPEVKKVIVKIQTGLQVGTTYKFEGKVRFEDKDAKSAEASYILNVIIDPLPITSLTIDKADNGDLKLTDYNEITAPNGGVFVDDDNNAATAAVPMSTVNFQTGDVSYVWAKAPVNVSVNKSSFTMTTGATNTIAAAATGVTVTSKTGKTLSAADIEPGVNYYLIAYSAKNTSNAADFAVSPAYQTTYPGIVYLNIDKSDKQGEHDADAADGTVGGAYKVVFVNNDDGEVVEGDVTWKQVSTDVWAYSQDLTPNTKGYTAKISRAKGDLADANLIALDKTIKGEPSIGTATTDANVVVANFFTVNPVAFIAEPYKTGTGEEFDYTAGTDGKSPTNTEIEPKFAIGADKAPLTDKIPTVLSGQTVTATAPKMDAPNDDKAWTQDYLLTWLAADTDDPADISDKTPAKVSATNAVKDEGAYSQTITAQTFIGGRLDQKTYDVVGTVKGTGGYVGQVDMTIADDDRNFTLTTKSGVAGKIYDHFDLEDDDGDGIHGEPNDTVTFKVVKGAYEITAFDGAATGAGDTPANAPASTVLKVTVGADPNERDDVADRSKETLGGDPDNNNPDVTANGRVFTMYVAGTDLKLGVDDDDAATPATSTAPAVSAGSGNVANNNKHADNTKVYYFNSTDTTPINLTLSNPGNADLKVKAEVFRFGSMDIKPDYATGSWTGGTALDKDHTYKDDTTGSVVTIAGATAWPTTGETVAVGAGVADSGVTAVNAGSITLNKTAPNRGDATYIVRFTSTYVDNNSTTPKAGPTVYYVFDLTVDPLPIVKVTAAADDNGTMRLENFVSSAEATDEKPENDGLNSVLVDHDGDGKTAATGGTDPMGAKLAGLVDDDIFCAWYTAPLFAADGTTPVTVDKNDFQFNSALGALELTPAGIAKGLVKGTATPGNNGKTYKPDDAEQGRNVYLVAYRANNNCNASDLAVSQALYAQVTIKLEARRFNDQDVPGGSDSLLTAVQIEGAYGDQTAASNTDATNLGIVVNDRDNRVIDFTGDMNDYLHGKPDGTGDKPNDAEWYFVGWDDSDGKDPSGNVGTFTNKTDYAGTKYTVTAQATVIGYYDKLPDLTGAKSCTLGETIAEASRTFTYTHYDGSGNVKIMVTPVGSAKFQPTGVPGEDLTAPREITVNDLTKIAEQDTGGTIGGDGQYVLDTAWIKANLNGDQQYTITFYDLKKGSKADGGYEGYDRSISYTTSTGPKEVTAVVADANKGQGHTVQVKGVTDGAEAATSTAMTKDGLVTLIAKPHPGYVFTGWTVTSGKGEFTEENGEQDDDPIFRPTSFTVTVTASFRKANLTQEPGHAKIHYGTQRFVENSDEEPNNYKNLTVGTSDENVTTNYAYTWLTGDDLKTYLTKTTAEGGLGMSEAAADALVAKTAKATDWLEWHNADATDNENKFVVKAAAKGVNVEKDDAGKDVTSELPVYVKATEQNSDQEQVVAFVIDIVTSELKIRTDGTGDTYKDDETQMTTDGAAYKTKYVGVYGTDGADPDAAKVAGTTTDGKIIHGNAVEREWFEFISIDNVDDKDKLDHLIEALTGGNKNNAGGATDENGAFTYVVTDKGVWRAVVPPTFNGAGSADENAVEYTFAFHYTGAEGAEDDYNYSDASIKIKIPVQRPQRDLLIADEVANYDDLKRGDTYSAIEAPSPDDGVTTPTKLAYQNDETKRLNESITYLDDEPIYTAKFKRIGEFNEGSIKLELDPEDVKAPVGFVLVKTDADGKETNIALNDTVALKALLDEAAGKLDRDDATATIKLKLAPVDASTNRWVGEHYIRFRLSGTENGETLKRYYTLSLKVNPKTIPEAHVTLKDNDIGKTPKIDKVMGQDPTEDDPTDPQKPQVELPKFTDIKGNHPIQEPTLVTDPTDPEKIKVILVPDPNYEFEPVDDPDDDTPDYTINGEPDQPDPKEGPKIDNVGKNVEMTTYVIYIGAHLEKKNADGTYPGTHTGISAGQLIADYVPFSDKEDKYPDNDLATNTMDKYGYGKEWWWSESTALGEAIDLSGEEQVKFEQGKTYVVTVKIYPDYDKYPFPAFENMKATFNGNLLGNQNNTTALFGHDKGFTQIDQIDGDYYLRYSFSIPKPTPPGGGGNTPAPCPCKVFYHIGLHGTTTNPTVEDVSAKSRPSKIPTVTALEGYQFKGWSLTNPATLKKGEEPVLVDPRTVEPTGETLTFYAVIEEYVRPFHEHYVIGYPNGNFGPADDINRASVATIIARAILPGFEEGANYGNPGGYSDVSGHWAESAIAYCTSHGVFEGYDDGTFKPDQPITRQEFALVMARLDGVMTPGEMDFLDIDEAGEWALGGIYTAYAKGWVVGYTDGTFKPLNNIRRDEAVKIFNAYLYRGVDAEGLRGLKEYVHSGVASNVTENGTDEYMTWPDVPKGHWAYYEIVEAANDHEYVPDPKAEKGYTVPEDWDKCWIDERWRYHDDINDGGPNAALVSAGFRVWLH